MSAFNQVNRQPLVRKGLKERRGNKSLGARKWVTGGLGKGQVIARIEPQLILQYNERA